MNNFDSQFHEKEKKSMKFVAKKKEGSVMWPIKMIKKSSKINMDIFKKKKAFKRHINKGALNICA